MELTGDSMVNGISEKGLSVNHKVKIVNFPGGTNEKILEKLYDITKKSQTISSFMLELMISLMM